MFPRLEECWITAPVIDRQDYRRGGIREEMP